MKKTTRVLSLAMALVLSVGMLTGCGGKPVSSTPAAGEAGSESSAAVAESSKPVEISIAIWGAEDGLSGGENDKVLKTLEEKTGVRLVPQNVTWDDAEQKIQLWATNGQLPDIFSGDFVGKSFFFNWVEQGVIRALPDDLSAYPNLKEYLTMERAVAAKQDGKYYMVPRQTYGDISYSVQDRNVVYRWDLAQKAGVTKEPETYDEFHDMIKKIIAADPEGKKVSGMTQALPQLLGGFIYPYGGIIDKKWVEKDGQFTPSYFAGDLKASMQLARDMYKEGTIEKDIALAKLDTSKEKFLQGQSAAMVFAGSGPAWLYNQIGRDYETLYGRKFLDDIRIAKLYPGADGKKYYFVDTESWSESYISSKVDDEKMAAICKLFDFLYSEEGIRLMFCGIEGEDYEISGRMTVMKEGVVLADKYPFMNPNSNINSIAMWNPGDWDSRFPSNNPAEYRALNDARHEDAMNNGTLPKYYDAIMFLSTPLKDKFVYNTNDDLMQIMMGTEPVDKMVDDLMAQYETKGLSSMLKEVNEAAAKAGISK
ncbi:extracellular solute-binding protein [Hydrogenoanaerobacterium sp.]|uniref:extracellular solute-binding protein n=1 Tax=Hydrogenoanaerobacterium sp. TaxID=2953763 RepID=UPI00289AE4D9|nr:extracellular solute-binding protein [Hydrogenoanaerobacterium sp.]